MRSPMSARLGASLTRPALLSAIISFSQMHKWRGFGCECQQGRLHPREKPKEFHARCTGLSETGRQKAMASNGKWCYLNSVNFIWLDKNIEHCTRPGHLPDTKMWERVFFEPGGVEFPASDFPGRFAREAEFEGVSYRIVYARTGPDEVFPITGFRIATRRRTRRKP